MNYKSNKKIRGFYLFIFSNQSFLDLNCESFNINLKLKRKIKWSHYKTIKCLKPVTPNKKTLQCARSLIMTTYQLHLTLSILNKATKKTWALLLWLLVHYLAKLQAPPIQVAACMLYTANSWFSIEYVFHNFLYKVFKAKNNKYCSCSAWTLKFKSTIN